MHGSYVTDILKVCMKKFNAENIIFDKFTGLLSVQCSGYTVSLACRKFIVLPEHCKPSSTELDQSILRP